MGAHDDKIAPILLGGFQNTVGGVTIRDVTGGARYASVASSPGDRI
jgi:hypothetical protein